MRFKMIIFALAFSMLTSSCALTGASEAFIAANEGYQHAMEKYEGAIAELMFEYESGKENFDRIEAKIDKLKEDGASAETLAPFVSELSNAASEVSRIKAKIESGETRKLFDAEIEHWAQKKAEAQESDSALPVWATILMGVLGSLTGGVTIAAKQLSNKRKLDQQNVATLASAIESLPPVDSDKKKREVAASMPVANKRAFSVAYKG